LAWRYLYLSKTGCTLQAAGKGENEMDSPASSRSAHERTTEMIRQSNGRGGSRPLKALALLATLAAGVLLAACGGSSPSEALAKERAQERQQEIKFADFAKCLREHGINAEVASMPGGGHGLKVSPGRIGGGHQDGRATMEAAQSACARYRPEPERVNLSPQQKVEMEEAVQKFAKCMREHGIKVEAKASGGGIQIGIHHRAGSGEPNPESPAFQQAQEACHNLLPRPPGAGKEGPFSSKSGQPAGPLAIR
jgi:hypothetical protein